MATEGGVMTAELKQSADTGAPASSWKPYPAYKDSGVEWLGKVPEHWEIKKLKYIAEIILGKMLTNDDNGGYFLKPYLRAQNINWQNVNSDDIKEMWFSKQELKQYRIKLHDLLISEGGEVGRTAIWKNEIEECYIQNSVHKVTMLPGNNPFYYLSLFFLYGQIGFFDSIVSRVSIAHLTKEKLKEVICFVPPLPEQRAISLYLDDRTRKIDTLIEKKQKLIDLLKEDRTATINQAVTKGLNPDVSMKDSGIEWLGEVPKHWEIRRLKYVAETNRNTLNESTDSDYEFQYIDIGNVTIEGLTHPPQLMKFKDAPSRARRVVKKGDTIVSTVRTYLKAIAYIEDKADNIIGSTGFAVLTSNGILNSKYLYYLMINEKIIDLINSLSTGVSYPAINSSDLADIVIWYPKEIREQQEIINHIEYEKSKTHHSLIKIEKEIALLQEYRTALISEVVTGKIDVRGE